MSSPAAVPVSRLAGLLHPGGERLSLNKRKFVALDRAQDATYQPTYRPQALYNRADNGFAATNETVLLHEVATNLPIYRQDTGPTDFHLHLPPGGFQFVLVTSGVFTFDYDGTVFHVGPGTVMLQSAIVHRQLFYTWSGLPTDDNLKTPQSVVPDSLSLGYSGKFLEAFVTDPTTFPNPTIVGHADVRESETPRTAFGHPLHDRRPGADFWLQDPLSLSALYRLLPASFVQSEGPAYIRDLEIEIPSGHLVTGHIIATDPRNASLLPKSASGAGDLSAFGQSQIAMYRVIRGTAQFRDEAGVRHDLVAGDVITGARGALELVRLDEDTQLLRLGLLEGLENLSRWTPTQRDEVDGLSGQIITARELRPLRGGGKPVGYLYD